MSHLFRFFGQRDNFTKSWRLEDGEWLHASKVLRLESGSIIELTNGAGWVALATLQILSKSKYELKIQNESFTKAPSHQKILLLGALKPGDMDDLIAPLVELGIDQIKVFKQEGSASFRTSEQTLDRWQRLIHSAVKQSKRPWSPIVEVYSSLESCLMATKISDKRWVLLPNASHSIKDLLLQGNSREETITALIGGEKGLSDGEESLAKKYHFTPVHCGPWILRARTAALACASFLSIT